MPLVAVRNEDYDYLNRCKQATGDALGATVHDALVLHANQNSISNDTAPSVIEEKTPFVPRVKTIEELRAEAQKRKERTAKCRSMDCTKCPFWDNCGRYLRE